MDIENVNNACSAGASQGSTDVSGSRPSGGLPAFDGPAAAVLDHRGTVVRWTGTAEDLTGFRAEDVCGRPVQELVADLPDDLRGATEMPASGRVRLWHQCGDTIDVTFRTTKVGARRRSSSWRPLHATSPTTSRAQRSCVHCPHRTGSRSLYTTRNSPLCKRTPRRALWTAVQYSLALG